jgi:hypothetical protein
VNVDRAGRKPAQRTGPTVRGRCAALQRPSSQQPIYNPASTDQNNKSTTEMDTGRLHCESG